MIHDWSELPNELVHMISEHIDNEIDLIRFRSICSNWRSSSISIHHTNILPFKFPLLKYVRHADYESDLSDSINDYQFSDNININDSNFPFSYLSKRTLFLIKPPPSPQQTLTRRPWLIRITQNSSGKTKILQPYAGYEALVPFASFKYSNALDIKEHSVIQLRTDFIVNKEDFTPSDDPTYYLIPENVLAVTCHGKKPLVLGALCYVSHRPMLFRGLDDCWSPICLSTFYGDTCLFKGRIYAVNIFGRTVVVGPDSIVHLEAEPTDSGVSQKLLVESEGKLLLVNMSESYYPDLFGIDLFQLDEKEKKWVRLGGFDEKKNEWVKLRDIGDRVLFLGSGCSFSTYASELGLPKGNCVVFIDDSVLGIRNMGRGHCIFHLDQDRLSPASEYPEYFNLFLPPEWILKS